MTTKVQRARVILALDCLASKRGKGNPLISSLLKGDARELAHRAWFEAFARYPLAFGDTDSWRYRYAEAAQLLREGSVK